MDLFDDVTDWHEAAGVVPFPETIGLPDPKRATEIMDQVTEEYKELVTALECDRSLDKTVDAFIDIMWTCAQGIRDCGLTSDEAEILFNEVARANWSKVDGPGLPLVKGGKIQKPPGFVPPDIIGRLAEIRAARGETP